MVDVLAKEAFKDPGTELQSFQVSKSNSREVTLTDVERETSGEFKCEVSADAPLFHTDIRSAHLLVADIPEDGPVLRNDVQKVAPGGTVKANCTTPGSYPSMNVTWFINDVEIHSSYDVEIHDSIFHYDALPGKETVRSTIYIRATPELFKNGKIKLRCLATMFTLYAMSKETEIQEDTPQLALIMVASNHPNEGVSNVLRNYKSNLLMTVLLFFVHLHAWLRRNSH